MRATVAVVGFRPVTVVLESQAEVSVMENALILSREGLIESALPGAEHNFTLNTTMEMLAELRREEI